MCFLVPARVLSIDGPSAVVDSAGQQRTVSLMLLDEPPEVGDYLRVQHEHFAVERLDPAQAREALALITELLEREAAGHA